MWQGEDFPLELCSIKFGGERKNEGKKKKKRGKKEKKRKKKRRGVRSSTFSLGFTEIGPSNFVRARGKFQLRDESFA